MGQEGNTMVVNVNTAEGFVQVANEMGGITSLIVEETRIVGTKLIGEASHAVILVTRRTDKLLEEIIHNTENQFGHRSDLYNNRNNPNEVKFSFRGKPDLVSALLTLGVDQRLLSAIKTAKVNEMKEFIDATAPKQIAENLEVAEIVLKLTRQSDRHTFKTKSSVLPEIVLTMEVQGTCPTYFITGSAQHANHVYQLESLSTIQTGLKLKGVKGSCGHQLN